MYTVARHLPHKGGHVDASQQYVIIRSQPTTHLVDATDPLLPD
jgi:hypothetical protein